MESSARQAAICIDADLLIDPAVLACLLPEAWAQVLAAEHGGLEGGWLSAYQRVSADWDSYWADLDLSGDDSLHQWREGRWRVVRGWFRLAGQEPPPVERMAFYLNDLEHRAGQKCAAAVRSNLLGELRLLSQRDFRAAVVSASKSMSLVAGMLAVHGAPWVSVIGPEQIGQIGLEGITWKWLAALAGGEPDRSHFVTRKSLPGIPAIAPPDNAYNLITLLEGQQPGC